MAMSGCADSGAGGSDSAGMQSAGGGVFNIVDLRCEDKVSPLGIDIAQPLLSWKFESDSRDFMQKAYRVLVASDPSILDGNRGDLWDSGEVAGAMSNNVEYTGAVIGSGKKVYWKVWARSESGDEAWSEPASWEMGLLTASDWQAKWIDYPPGQGVAPATKPTTTKSEDRKTYPPNFPPYIRKTFAVSKPIARARLYVTALGLYRCWVNGTAAGNAIFAPDWTNYHHHVRYETYDVTASVAQGVNAIAATLGDGWYCGNVGFVGGHIYGSRPALLAQLVIDYSDGSREVVATDESWRATTGPIRHSDMLNGEDYDAQQEMPGWKLAGFDDTSWQHVSLRDEKPALEAAIAPPVRESGEIAVKSVREPKPGHFVFDFGQNMVGYAQLTAAAPAGTKITLRFAEMLNPDGTLYTDNLRTAKATDTYICKGGRTEVWKPTFTFHGFRYAEMTGYPGTATAGMLRGIVVGTDNPRAGTFECSHPLLNKLYSNIVWGQRGNFLSVPTDCPQRDERLGWMGDAQVFIRTATCNCDVHNFFNNWLVEVADSQSADGAFSDVTPHVGAGQGVAAWADAGVICPWTIYEIYGDKRVLARQYDSVAKFIVYLQKNSTNLIRPADGYGDWLNVNDETPKDLLATAYFAHSVDLASRMARVLDKSDDEMKYAKLFADIRSAFDKKFVDKDGKLTGNTQTGYLLALQFNLLDEAMQHKAVEHLVACIEARHDHLSTGFVGVGYLLPVLTRFDKVDLAYRLMEQETYPSWLFPVKNGATTIWERWDGWTPEKGFQTPTMNSFNHYSLGSCGQWMVESMAGIGLDTRWPGFGHVVIRPRIGGGLKQAGATYLSPYGQIESRWEISPNGDVKLVVTIPPNSTAMIYVPAAKDADVRESGRNANSAAGLKFKQWEDGAAVFAAGSGHYTFESKL